MGAKSKYASHQINTIKKCLQELDKEFQRVKINNITLKTILFYYFHHRNYFIYFIYSSWISLPGLEEKVLGI